VGSNTCWLSEQNGARYARSRGPTVAVRGLLGVAHHVGLVAVAAQAAAARALPARVRRQAGSPGPGLEPQDAERLGNLRKGHTQFRRLDVGKAKREVNGQVAWLEQVEPETPGFAA